MAFDLSGRLVVQTGEGVSEGRLPAPAAYPGLEGVAKAAIHDHEGIRFNLVTFAAGSVVPAHPSPTVNHWIVVSGEIFSTVPGRPDVALGTGDCCVQVDLPHGWRVGTGGPATLLAVVVDLVRPDQAPAVSPSR